MAIKFKRFEKWDKELQYWDRADRETRGEILQWIHWVRGKFVEDPTREDFITAIWWVMSRRNREGEDKEV